jgi:GNAT superfamily N-acetyltransferase
MSDSTSPAVIPAAELLSNARPSQSSIPRWMPIVFGASGFAALIYQVVWQRVLFAAFGGRPQSVPLVSAMVGRPYWHHYVARDGGTLVASASMYAREGFAWLGAAGTLASHRGRGAQGALIARRIDDARALGCHTFTTETAPDEPGKPNPSSQNMERAGFKVAYRRHSWVYPDPGHG